MLPENRIPSHPGEILQEHFLEPLGLTRVALSEHLGVPVQRINEIVRGKRGVTPESAWLLAQAFDTTPEFWISLQTNHDLAVNRPSKVISPLRKAGGEGGSVMIDSHADPTAVGCQVIDPVRNGAPQLRLRKVMDFHPFRLSLRPPFTPAILEFAYQLFLLCVDGDHRVGCRKILLSLAIDVLKLSVAIRMTCSFQRLAVALKAISQNVEEVCHNAMTYLVPHLLQVPSQMPNTLGGPPHGRLRISTLRWIDELLQILFQGRVNIDRLLAASTWPPDTLVTSFCWSLEFFDTPTDGRPGHADAARHDGDSPKPNHLGLCSRHQATGLLIKVRREKIEPVPNRLFIYHYTSMIR